MIIRPYRHAGSVTFLPDRSRPASAPAPPRRPVRLRQACPGRRTLALPVPALSLSTGEFSPGTPALECRGLPQWLSTPTEKLVPLLDQAVGDTAGPLATEVKRSRARVEGAADRPHLRRRVKPV